MALQLQENNMQYKSTCLFLSVSLTKYCSLILPLHYTTFLVPYCRDIKSGRHGNSSLQRWILLCEKSLCFCLCCNRSIPEDSWPSLSLRERKRDSKREYRKLMNSEVCYWEQLVMAFKMSCLISGEAPWQQACVTWLADKECALNMTHSFLH